MAHDECHIQKIKPLISPDVLMEQLPIDEKTKAFITKTRQDVAEILNNTSSPRQLLIIGPCSIHHIESALEYAHKLRYLANELQERYLVIMRVYFEKPRTRVGWKGLINDPNLNGGHHINEGLYQARKLLISINEMEVPCGVEFLDTITPQYIADLTVWGAIGARTVESQVHRQLASGLSMPVGLKNSTYGYIDTAIDAVISAQSPHSFMGITKQGIAGIVVTKGNPNSHIILRGGTKTGPNYTLPFISDYSQELERAGVKTGIIVDCSHGNSQKNHLNQMDVYRYITDPSNDLKVVRGLMIESNIYEGNQPLKTVDQLQYGVSITDACLSWQQTYQLLTLHQIYLLHLTIDYSEEELSVSCHVNQPELNSKHAQNYPIVLGASRYYVLFLPISVIGGQVVLYPNKLLRDIAARTVKIPFETSDEATSYFESFRICLDVLDDSKEIFNVLLDRYGMYYIPETTTDLFGVILDTRTSQPVTTNVFKIVN